MREADVMSLSGSQGLFERRGSRLALVMTLLAVLAALATWYGFLVSGGNHPFLKLGGAMTLAGAGIVVLLFGRPADGVDTLFRRHSTLVEVSPLRLVIAWLSIAAALIHFAVIQQHMTEYWLYGAFFIVVALVQLISAVMVVIAPSRLLLQLVAGGNAVVVATWVLTRTYGSLLGPAATIPAKVGFGDIVSTAFSVTILLGSLVTLRRHDFRPREGSEGEEIASVLAALAIALLTVLALYSAVGGSPFVSHVG